MSLEELRTLLGKGGYSKLAAERLYSEGMGPEELEQRMREPGGLTRTHGIAQLRTPKGKGASYIVKITGHHRFGGEYPGGKTLAEARKHALSMAKNLRREGVELSHELLSGVHIYIEEPINGGESLRMIEEIHLKEKPAIVRRTLKLSAKDFRVIAQESASSWWRDSGFPANDPPSAELEMRWHDVATRHELTEYEELKRRSAFSKIFRAWLKKWRGRGVCLRRDYLGKDSQGNELWVESVASAKDHRGKFLREKKQALIQWKNDYLYTKKSIRARKPSAKCPS